MATKRALVLPDELETVRARLVKDELYHIVGNSSLFVPQLNTKYIDKTSCRDWPDIDGEVEPRTPGEAARLELQRFYPECNFRARKTDFKLLDIAPPILFNGKQYHGHLYYIDLKGAYASIYRWLTLDCCWPRGSGEMPLAPVAARLWNWKVARNSVVGVTRAHTMIGVKGKTSKYVHFRNPFFNAHLWHTIQRILHELAALAVRQGAIYVSTDCYILNNKRGYTKLVDILQDEFCFELHTGDGDGDIRGWGSYSIDGVKGTTRSYETHARLDNILDTEKGRTLLWLKRYINK